MKRTRHRGNAQLKKKNQNNIKRIHPLRNSTISSLNIVSITLVEFTCGVEFRKEKFIFSGKSEIEKIKTFSDEILVGASLLQEKKVFYLKKVNPTQH